MSSEFTFLSCLSSSFFVFSKWSFDQHRSSFLFLLEMSGRSRRQRAAGQGGGSMAGGGAAAAERKTSDGNTVDDAHPNAPRQVVTLVDASEQSLDKLLSRAGRKRGMAHDAALRRASQVSFYGVRDREREREKTN